MKIHERELIVRKASRDLDNFMADLFEKSELTEGERLRVVAEVFGGYVSSVAKYTIRAERHPDDPDKPGGLA